MSDRLKKNLVVIFLTLLIWAWAYMQLEESRPFTGTLEVSSSADPSLLVTLSLAEGNPLPQTKILLTSLNLQGAPSPLSELKKRYDLPLNDKNKEAFDFYYDPAEHGRTEGTYTLDLLEYLKKSSKIQDMKLTLESCTPPKVTVIVDQLVEKELPIECRDENGSLIPDVKITPAAFAKIYVRKGDNDPVVVKLTQQQRETARKQPVEVTPYVELGMAKVRREAASPVQIALQSEARLIEQPFQPTSIGFVMSPKITGSYKVELVNETKVTESLQIKTTPEAKEAYQKMQYHILIEIRDGDELLPEISLRPVIYNFPPEHFKKGDIDIVEVPVPKTATFKLIPINPEVN